MLNDKNTYTVIKRNPTTNLERNSNKIVKDWFQKSYIDKRKYFSLRSSDCPLPKAYGLPKIHKENTPLRIIVSSIGTALYPLASFMQEIISENIPQAIGHVNNSFDLYCSLSGRKIPNSYTLISLDVISLFTNVPTDLAINGIINRWPHIKDSTKIPINEFVSTIKFILTSTYFTFNNIVYKQTFSTPMGSPLSPIIADIVMQDLEYKALNSLKLELPFYERYVDDIALAAPTDKIGEILNVFNYYHQRIQFTIEREKDRSLVS
jgi:hypothetical protein